MSNSPHLLRAKALHQLPLLITECKYSLFAPSELEVDWNKWTFEPPKSHLRFGHYVEMLFASLIEAAENYELLAKNVQLVENGITKGELDFIIRHKHTSETIHLELACKFYLEKHLPDSDHIHIIGPNGKDRLDLKLEKLCARQFPILHSEVAKPVLDKLNLSPNNISQKLCLTGMLFSTENKLPVEVNKNAVAGICVDLDALASTFGEHAKYALPPKMDWLLPIKQSGTFSDIGDFRELLKPVQQRQRNPMFWVKTENEEFFRAFFRNFK